MKDLEVNERINNFNSLPEETQTTLFLQSLIRSAQKQVNWVINPRDLEVIDMNSQNFAFIYMLFDASITQTLSQLRPQDRQPLLNLLRATGIEALGNINL